MKFLQKDFILSEQELDMDPISSKGELQDANKRKYNRISTQKRELLLEKIFFDGKKIKNAAKELKINYSSAKTILHLYRKKIKKQGKIAGMIAENKRCSVKQIFDANKAQSNISNRGNEFTIVISQGGREQNKTVLNTNPFLQNQNSAKIAPIQQQQQQKQQQRVNEVKIDTKKLFEFEQEKEESVSNSVIVTKIEENNSSSQMSNFYDQSTNNTIAQNTQPQLQKGYISNTSQMLYSTNNSQQNLIQNQQQNNKVNNNNNLRNILGPNNVNLNFNQQQQLFQLNFGPYNQQQQNVMRQFSF